MRQVISNPPYNLKWEHPFFASAQPRFWMGLPPKSNANLAFILTALADSERATFILPMGVLTSEQAEEKAIKQQLIESGLIKAIIALPDNMFVSTSIPTCLILLEHDRTDQKVLMIDLTKSYDEEVREQRGQTGNKNRVYKKTFKVLKPEVEQEVEKLLAGENSEALPFGRATIEDIKSQDYNLSPRRYIELPHTESLHRALEDIVTDLNRIAQHKGAVKITINEKMAKSLGMYELGQDFQRSKEISKVMKEQMKQFGLDIEVSDSMKLSRNKEFKIEVKDFERLPEFITLATTFWTHQMLFLNNEENRLLAELRDAILPKLLSGELEVTD